MEQNRFSRFDTKTLIKYQNACRSALAFSHMASIEKSLELIEKELEKRMEKQSMT